MTVSLHVEHKCAAPYGFCTVRCQFLKTKNTAHTANRENPDCRSQELGGSIDWNGWPTAPRRRVLQSSAFSPHYLTMVSLIRPWAWPSVYTIFANNTTWNFKKHNYHFCAFSSAPTNLFLRYKVIFINKILFPSYRPINVWSRSKVPSAVKNFKLMVLTCAGNWIVFILRVCGVMRRIFRGAVS